MKSIINNSKLSLILIPASILPILGILNPLLSHLKYIHFTNDEFSTSELIHILQIVIFIIVICIIFIPAFLHGLNITKYKTPFITTIFTLLISTLITFISLFVVGLLNDLHGIGQIDRAMGQGSNFELLYSRIVILFILILFVFSGFVTLLGFIVGKVFKHRS